MSLSCVITRWRERAKQLGVHPVAFNGNESGSNWLGCRKSLWRCEYQVRCKRLSILSTFMWLLSLIIMLMQEHSKSKNQEEREIVTWEEAWAGIFVVPLETWFWRRRRRQVEWRSSQRSATGSVATCTWRTAGSAREHWCRSAGFCLFYAVNIPSSCTRHEVAPHIWSKRAHSRPLA